MDADLESRFHSAMLDIYHRAKSEAGYNATRFLQMLTLDRGLVVAHRLLQSPHSSDGLAELMLRGRGDLAVESLIQRPEFVDLFSPDEVKTAIGRVGDRRAPPSNP